MSFYRVDIGNVGRRSAFVFLVAAILVWSYHCGKAEVIPSIVWSPHNPIFLETNYELNVFPYTQLYIVCPNAWTILKTRKRQVPKTEMYENIWRVDESGYKTCSTGKETSQPALILCDSPLKAKYDTFVFRVPADSSTTFAPGKEYFFIGTSNGKRSSLNSTSGGHCATHNMRLKVYACKNREDKRCRPPTKKLSTTQAPKEEDTVSPPISYAKCNNTGLLLKDTDDISKICNNTVCGTNKTEIVRNTQTFVGAVAILGSVAVLSMALNAFLLWQKCKQGLRQQTEPAS